MNNYQQILDKLEGFIRKYYTNELIKGALLFFAIGLLYFLISVGFEYFFWLGKLGRSILFWLFVGVEAGLFIRFLIFPLTKLIKLSKGLDYFQASKIIGAHFPQVNDKLLNVLQLQANRENTGSELLLASIQQKAADLQPVPFQLAVSFKGNLKYLKYAGIPLLVILAIYISGKSELFSEGYTRMVHYQQAYEPPAPFRFVVMNSDLHAQENEKYTLKIRTDGRVVPEEASIHFNGQRYFLKPISPGVFEFSFDQVKASVPFYFSANKVRSRAYTLAVSAVPIMLSFQMNMEYPAYLHKKNEVLKGTGNATIPEGTKVHWKLAAKHTDRVQMQKADTTELFAKSAEHFEFDQSVFSTLDYRISTSNSAVKNYENLAYRLTVIPDERPKISMEMKKDSVNEAALYFRGKVSDDHGLSKLQLVYYPSSNEKKAKIRKISLHAGDYEEFLYSFPDTLSLKPGTSYDFYFQIFDNDRVNGSKSNKSATFSYRKLTKNETEERQLKQQEQTIKGMNTSLEKLKAGDKKLKEIDALQKQKSKLNYSDRQKLKNFVEHQQRQEQLMKNYSKELKKNLEQFQPENKEDGLKKKLQERLGRNEKRLKENEKLLEELKKYQNKISKEQLNQKIEKLTKHNQNEQKNLEELLELTKRYYVEKKAEKITSKIKQLAKKQEKLANAKEKNSSESQQKLNDEFNALQKKMDAWEQENEALKSPMELKRDLNNEEGVRKDQQFAKRALKKVEGKQQKNTEVEKSAAEKKQQSAADKLKEMGKAMQQQMMQSGAEQQAEDAKMLRQVLDNLVTFSFQQEDLMKDFQEMGKDHPDFPDKLRYQNVLKENFEHVDDSLYALALRNPVISDKINEKLTDVSFSIDKALERLAQNELRTGVASQRYVFKGANDLAAMLDESLQHMQRQMQMTSKGKGKGKGGRGKGRGGKGFQLPDIIKKQGDLGEALKKGMQKGGKKSGNKNGNGQQGKKSGKKGGQNAGGGNWKNGEIQSEKMNGELYEIFKHQQELRQQLEDMIRKEGLGEKAKQLAKQMERMEQSLLQSGFTPQNEQQLQLLKHQLLKLKDASLQQNRDNERKATTNRQHFKNETKANLKKAKEYFNTTEILNRQPLPLRQNYQQMVQDYFKQADD